MAPTTAAPLTERPPCPSMGAASAARWWTRGRRAGPSSSRTPPISRARYSDPPAGFETAGLESILAIPLPELTEGTVHGALGFGWTEPQELTLADLDVASTIAELVAGALARARSMEQVRTKAALEEQRADIATALMDATTVDRVARRTLAVLSRQLEVAWGYVAVGDTTREGPVLRATLPDRREHQDWDVPAFDHLQPGATPWVPDAVLQRLSGGEPIGRCEALVIPGGPIHVVVVAGWRPHDDGSSQLGDVADIVTQAILRAGVFDREASTAEALQDALLTTDSHSREVVFATRYRPAESPMLVGGDWYDLVVDDGRVLVTVGDVVGQGLPAATVMGQLRSALRAALLGSADPIAALEVVDRFAGALGPSTFATAAVAALEPASDALTFCYAGHPPLLHIGRDGAVRPEEGGRSWPIGTSWPGPRPRTVGRVGMEPAEAHRAVHGRAVRAPPRAARRRPRAPAPGRGGPRRPSHRDPVRRAARRVRRRGRRGEGRRGGHRRAARGLGAGTLLRRRLPCRRRRAPGARHRFGSGWSRCRCPRSATATSCSPSTKRWGTPSSTAAVPIRLVSSRSRPASGALSSSSP